MSYLFKNKHDSNINSKYSNCELGDLVGDDVERIEYQNFYIDYHTEDFTKSQIEDFAQKCVKMNGIIIVDKPSGYTSRDIVNSIERFTNSKKVGHGGTLDPIATGVLVVAVGNGLKVLEFLSDTSLL